jgi:hypothetical protein
VNFVKHKKKGCRRYKAQAVHCELVCDLVDFLLSNVVTGLVVLSTVVAMFRGARGPEVMELALGIAAAEPVELHVH